MEGSEQEGRLLALFDFCWFDRNVLQRGPVVLPGDGVGSESSPAEGPSLVLPCEPTRHRALGDGVARSTSSDSELLAHRGPGHSPIISGKLSSKEGGGGGGHGGVSAGSVGVTEGKHGRCRKGRARGWASRRLSRSKSLSELEFAELKGFIDLGFTFSKAEADERLLSIVPGLQRLGWRPASLEESGKGAEADDSEEEPEEEGGVGASGTDTRRPYLSEAWEVVDLEERSRTNASAHDHLLRNWRVPTPGEGVDMKTYLRCWAHAVASAAR
ncbi:hypothetical protein Taro_053029 [Colocasia esculenta]|uniref:Uncharacterized protein n=1 Tax=Colocasia esculenta TaxID=4460 RepID=A0A843XLU1_COLES|nr:hypothetical protein [Colocasia esculenta]